AARVEDRRPVDLRAPAVVAEQIDRNVVFEDGDVGVLLDGGDERALHLAAGQVLGVNDPAARVTPFPPQGKPRTWLRPLAPSPRSARAGTRPPFVGVSNDPVARAARILLQAEARAPRDQLANPLRSLADQLFHSVAMTEPRAGGQ